METSLRRKLIKMKILNILIGTDWFARFQSDNEIVVT